MPPANSKPKGQFSDLKNVHVVLVIFDRSDKRQSSLYTSVFQITLPCYVSKHSVSDAKQDPLIATDVRIHAAGV